MNIVEFALKFKDLASGELGKFGNAARTTFANATKLTDNLTGHNKVLSSSYGELQKQIKQVESTIRNSTIPSQIREAKRELASLQRQASKHSGNTDIGGKSGGGMGGMLGLAGLGKFVGPAAILGVGLAAGQFLGESINKGLERQQIQTSLNVLTGSPKVGNALSADLIKYQKDTILGPEVFKNAQTMLGFGIKANEVMPNLKMLGDVSMGDAEKLGSLTLAFSQIRAAGKLQGQDLLQLINAGYNPLESISNRTGKSMGQLKKEMEGGKISFEMVRQAFQDSTSEGGKFNKMLETIAETPAGKMQALGGAWNEFKIKAGAAFMPLVSMALDLGSQLLPIIESVITPLSTGVEQVSSWIKNISKDTNGWMNYIATIKDYMMNYVFPFIQKVWFAVWNIVSKLFEFIGKSQLIQDIFRFIYASLSGALVIVGSLIDGLVWVFDNIVMPILNAIEGAYRLIKGSSMSIKTQQTVKTTGGKSLADTTNTDLLGQVAKNTAENATASKSNEKAITGGGPKTINITVQKFLDAININTTNLRASENDIESNMLEMFARVVAQGA